MFLFLLQYVAVKALILTDTFVSQGSTFSIIPYVCPRVTGSVAGIVGAGGNLGGVIFILMIQQWSYKAAFRAMGCSVICSSLLILFISINGHAGFVFGADSPEVLERRGSTGEPADDWDKPGQSTESPPAQNDALQLRQNDPVHK